MRNNRRMKGIIKMIRKILLLCLCGVLIGGMLGCGGGSSKTVVPGPEDPVVEPEIPVNPDAAIYVAPNGKAANPGTLASPTTLEKAITTVRPGGLIYMRGGTYYYNSTITIDIGNNGTRPIEAKSMLIPMNNQF